MEFPQLIMLGLCAASLALSWTTFFLVVRQRGLRWKPAWALLALFGTGGAAMVSAAPDQLYWLFRVAIPTASYASFDGNWQPATVSCLFPLGALVAMIRLYFHRHQPRRAKVTDAAH